MDQEEDAPSDQQLDILRHAEEMQQASEGSAASSNPDTNMHTGTGSGDDNDDGTPDEESDDEGLEEEDRELIEENLGPRGFRRLQQKAAHMEDEGGTIKGEPRATETTTIGATFLGQPGKDNSENEDEDEDEDEEERVLFRKRVAPEELEKLFAEEEELEPEPSEQGRRLSRQKDDTDRDRRKAYDYDRERRLLGSESDEDEVEMDDEDELADFIEDEDEDRHAYAEGEGRGEARRMKGTAIDSTATAARRKASSQYLAEAFGSSHLPTRVIRDILEIFGDGTDYLDLVDDENGEGDRKDGDYQASGARTRSYEGKEIRQREGRRVVEGEGTEVTGTGENHKEGGERTTTSNQQTSDLEALILRTDLPESLVRRDGADRSAPGEGELEAEASWIVQRWQQDRQLATKFRDVAPEALQTVITSVLQLLRIDGLEVPTVATHRKELFQHLLTLNDLWAIWDADEQWKLFNQQRTIALHHLAECEQSWLGEHDGEADSPPGTLADVKNELSLMREVLRAADSLGTVELVAEYLKDRRQVRADPLALVHDQFAQRISLPMGQFLENVSQQTILHTIPAPGVVGEEGSPQITAAVLLTALTRRLAKHPYGVQYLRALLEPLAIINVRPTERGLLEIDPLHELAPIKYVTGKSLAAFIEDHFLWIVKGAGLGLLTYELTFTEESALIEQLATLYDARSPSKSTGTAEEENTMDVDAAFDGKGESGSGQSSTSTPSPNPALDEQTLSSVRRQAIRRAMEESIIPRVRREMITRLRTESERWVAMAAQYTFQDRLMVAPYDPTVVGHPNPARGEIVRVLACAWSETEQSLTDEALCRRPSPPLVCAVIVDATGRVLEQTHFPWSTEDPNESPDRLLDLLEIYSPSCVLVTGRSLSTRILYERLRAALKGRRSGKSPHNNSPSLAATEPPVQYVEDDIARVYATSARGQRDWPDSSSIHRYLISAARRFLCPLTEYTAATESELLALELSGTGTGLINLVPREMRLKYLTRAAINVVNLVGVDVSEAVTGSHGSWLVRAPLAYVCGLGPVRARQLLRDISRRLPEGRLLRRTQLSKLVPARVYANCASFLRICPQRKRPLGEGDPLDETRIHPEHYGLARKMAADAMEMEVGEPSTDLSSPQSAMTDDDPVGSEAVRRVMREPGRLDDLLLEAYAQELVRRGLPSKHLTLLDIKAELQRPYADLRTPCAPPAPAVIFSQLTGENERTLWVGAPVRVTIGRGGGASSASSPSTLPAGHLPSGLSAVLVEGAGRLGERRSPSWRTGQVLPGRVLAINLDRLEVEVAIGREVERLPGTPRQPLDQYYDHELARSATSLLDRPRSEPVPMERRPRRPLVAQGHPAWRDVSRQEAESILKDALLGEVILRPSGSRGPDHVSLTWKIDDDQGRVALFQHLDIGERGPHQLLLGGGRGEETFEDYDEIIARYVEPVAANLRDVRATPKYLPLSAREAVQAVEAIKEHLVRERDQRPGRIAYCLTLARERPGQVLLSWQPASRPHHELIEVDPRGFTMRGKHFERIEQLIGWFKQGGASERPPSDVGRRERREEIESHRRDEAHTRRRGGSPPSSYRTTSRGDTHQTNRY